MASLGPLRASLIGGAFLIAIGLSAFALGRWLGDDPPATGGPGEEQGQGVDPQATPSGEPTVGPTVPDFPTEEAGPSDYRDEAIEAEFEKPRFSGVVNGIEVGVGAPVEIPAETCTPGNSTNVPIEEANGSVVEVSASYLPEGAELTANWAVECQGNYILTYQEWSLTVPDIGAAVLQITRFVSSNRPFDFDTSAGRVEAGEVNGKPAVFVEPVIPEEGYGPAGVAISEDFGMTLVTSINLTLEELRLIAEGLE
jgi:hypothetical protein